MNSQSFKLTINKIDFSMSPLKLKNSKYYWHINIHCVNVGSTEEEAKETCNRLKQNFSNAGICDTDKVAVLLDDENHIVATSRLGRDLWIDVRDDFKVKTFEELNIVIKSLKVY